MDSGAWLSLAQRFLGNGAQIEMYHLEEHCISNMPGAPAYAKAYSLTEYEAIDLQAAKDQIDIVVWTHPAQEMIEVDHKGNKSTWDDIRFLAEHGVPVYVSSFSTADAECQSILFSQDGFELTGVAQELPINPFAFSVTGVGYQGGWGLVTAQLVKSEALVSVTDRAAVRCAFALVALRAVCPEGWFLGRELSKSYAESETTIALLGEFALGVSSGRVYRMAGECDEPILECIGHLWDALRIVPTNSRDRLIWAAKVYLLHFSEMEISDKDRSAAIAMLESAAAEGCNEAKVALAFSLSDSINGREAVLAAQCFEDAAEHFPHIQFMKAVELAESGSQEKAIALMRKASEAGYPAALHDYGRYLVGLGGVRSYEGLFLIQRAADLGERDACVTQASIRFENEDFHGALRMLRSNWQEGDQESLEIARSYVQLLRLRRDRLNEDASLAKEIEAVERRCAQI